MLFLDVTFDINLSTLIALLIGIGFGCVLTVLIATLITLFNIKKKNVIISSLDKEVSEEEVLEDIKKVKEAFSLQVKQDKEINFKVITGLSLQLIRQIATRFYPHSKEPIAELSIEELILLDRYVIEKLEKFLNNGPLKPLKKLRISQVLTLLNIKSNIEHNKVVQTAKKYKLGSIASAISTVVQFINPAMWFKKLVLHPCINLISKKIILIIFDVIGQETYHIYSKQVFLDPVDEKEIQTLISIIEKEQAISN